MAQGDLHFVTRAHIGSRSISPDGTDVRALLDARATDPSIFDETEPFIWPAVISNNTIDFYGTRMHESSLRNYAADLVSGIAFQHSHDYREFVGRSLSGEFQVLGETAEDGVPIQQTWGDFYTIPGRKFGTMGTDDFIAGVRAGILSDVSIGFWASDYRCSICSKQVYDWWTDDGCMHIPGMDYAVASADGTPMIGTDGQPVTVRAFAWVHNAHISEASSVYDGATEGCAIVKARQLAGGGAIDERMMQRVEARYRTKLPRTTQIAVPALGGNRMTQLTEEQQRQIDEAQAAAQAEEQNEDTRAVGTEDADVTFSEPEARAVESESDEPEHVMAEYDLTALNDERQRLAPLGLAIKEGANPVRVIAALSDEVVRLRGKVADLTEAAAVGQRYHDELIDDTLASAVRALGSGIDRERHKRSLSGLTVDDLKAQRSEYEDMAAKRFPAGRQTTEGGEPEQPAKRANDPKFFQG